MQVYGVFVNILLMLYLYSICRSFQCIYAIVFVLVL